MRRRRNTPVIVVRDPDALLTAPMEWDAFATKMTRLRALVLLSVAAVLAGAAGCSLGDSDQKGALEREEIELPDPPCREDFREVEGLGTACPLEDGTWKVRLDDGTTVITHGQDTEDAVLTLSSIPQKGSFRAPVCTQQNPNGNYHFVAIIAWPSDVAPKTTEIDLATKIYAANHTVWQAAQDSGSPGADLVFACSTASYPICLIGQLCLRVDSVPLSFTKAQATFGQIVSELRSKGYKKGNEKYVVWYDAAIPPVPPLTVVPCGEATGYVSLDESAGAGNLNNLGPSYGISYDCDAILHELAHNIGAVQRNAPQATTWWHCWEEQDVMCYQDGNLPSGKVMVTNCPGTDDHFDCKHDDYFDAAIGAGQGGGPGSYLDKNWNLAACYVRYVVNYASACLPRLQLYIDLTAIFARGVRLVWKAAAESSQSVRYIVYRDNHVIGQAKGEPGTEIEFVDDAELVPGATYEYRIAGLDADGEFDSNSNSEQVTIPD
jgi:hypothetical protein